jgi:uncharacterized protein (DUF58 family)
MGWIYIKDEIFIQLTSLCSLVIISCYIWTYLSVRQIDVSRKSRIYRQNVGEYFEEYFEIKNKLPIWRFWLEITDHSNLENFFVSRVISSLGPNQLRSFSSYTLLRKRGAFQLGPISITSGDPFGLFFSRIEIDNEVVLLVFPFYELLKQHTLHFGMLMGGNSLKRPSLETTPHAAGIREYYPGDPLNRIHWLSSIRKNQIMVKEFDQDPQASVWLYLDGQQTINTSIEVRKENEPEEKLWMYKKKSDIRLPCDTFEYAVSITASLSEYFIKQGRSVGFCCSGKKIEVLSSDKGERQLSKILEVLTFLKSNGDLPIRRLVETKIQSQGIGTTVILITTSTALELREVVEMIKQRGFYPILIILDTISFGGKSNPKNMKDTMIDSKISVIKIKYGEKIKDVLQK